MPQTNWRNNWCKISVTVNGHPVTVEVQTTDGHPEMLNIRGIPNGRGFDTYQGSMPWLKTTPPEQQVQDTLEWWANYCSKVQIVTS